MTQRIQYTYHQPIVIGSEADTATIHRIARRIFSRHLNEGDPVTWQQAKRDADRAWWEVQQRAVAQRKAAS